MPRAILEGFECARCGHKWYPRENTDPPHTCPKCKSPYWDRPRAKDIKPENRVTCTWTQLNLTGKRVEYELVRGKKTIAGVGTFSASDLGDGMLQISILPFDDPENAIHLVQAEADCVKTHPGKYRFSCFSRSKPA